VTPALLETLAGITRQGGDVDDVLRAVVRQLAEEPGVAWAGIRFVEGDELVLGPSAGAEDDTRPASAPITYRGSPVGELVVHGDLGADALARVAELVAPFVLLGWDTGGEAWNP
jgi:hypothetical protein